MASNIFSKIVYLVCDESPWFWAITTLLFISISFATHLFLSKKLIKGEKPLPPGPRGLPLVGNLPFLKPNLHRYFSDLSQIYGPIFKLKLGTKLYVVVSSPSLAKMILKDHDTLFANHNPSIAASILSYGGNDMVWKHHGPDWRLMRKVFVREMMSNTSLNACYNLRRREVKEMVREVYTKIGTSIDIGELIFVNLLNMMMNMVWGAGTVLGEERTSKAVEFRKVISEMMFLVSKANVSDIFPILACFDIQRIERKGKELLLWMDCFFDSFIGERLKLDGVQEKGMDFNGTENKDFLQILLELKQQGDGKTSLNMMQVKALLMDIVLGGTDTSATTLEWAMAEMMQHPEVMRKAREELDQVVGTSKMVEESYLSKLPYLNAVVKETLRLHPPIPLLIPHCPSQSCTIGQYTIPKDTNVFLNVWKMHRDPEVWESPLEFLPERFSSDSNGYDYNGNNFSFLPFGSGRRICTGIPLVEKMSTYVLASLLHSFEWQLSENVELDLSEQLRFLLKKTTPLLMIPTPRLFNVELYI
ncbi:flavonoid 3',5'-hydroxylase 2-like [Telopea speciosissima]|uniref:flavonoid 3',5'-hydroxylase 2-like n=1 Tax=Telopea speciosissima TaxID=54955 RepID=UPI001CC52DA0|nr:flavonoid 3',5'-hydroxylase 2-like [Telopea speciosissima]